MENFAITLVCIALLIIGAVSISMASLNAVNTMGDALREEQQLGRDIVNSGISCENSSVNGSGDELTLYVMNDGKTKLAEYSSWDVILRYQGGDTVWIPYSSSIPGWQCGDFFFPGTTGDIRAWNS
jgi:hypothetical protein